jgi:hypothetical protein
MTTVRLQLKKKLKIQITSGMKETVGQKNVKKTKILRSENLEMFQTLNSLAVARN